jgi:predicted metal-dependent hydrolase
MVQRTPAKKPGRPRDPDAPPKPKRPRDELGRPLSHEAENMLHLEDYDSLSIEENHRLGIEHLNAGRFFPAHEAWETCWKQAKGTDEAEFFKGLSQLGAGYTHLRRGNLHGAYTLLRRGAGRILRYGESHRGIEAGKLAAAAMAHAEALEEAERHGRPAPHLTPPKI